MCIRDRVYDARVYVLRFFSYRILPYLAKEVTPLAAKEDKSLTAEELMWLSFLYKVMANVLAPRGIFQLATEVIQLTVELGWQEYSLPHVVANVLGYKASSRGDSVQGRRGVDVGEYSPPRGG